MTAAKGGRLSRLAIVTETSAGIEYLKGNKESNDKRVTVKSTPCKQQRHGG